jgi:hypothetical protein
VINDGKRFVMNYESDSFYDYLKHLLLSPMCRGLIGLDYNTVLVWFRRLDGARQHFSVCWNRPTREPMGYEPELQLHNRGAIEGRMVVMPKASPLEVLEEELA